MRIILDGDQQTAGSFVGFARNKASLLPATSDQIYRIGSGVLVRIQKLRGNTTIYIHAGTSIGYQFVIPFSFRNFPSDPRLYQTIGKYTGGALQIPTAAGVAYVDEITGINIAPEAYGSQQVGGTAFMNIWWGEDREYVAVATPQQRYGLGFLSQMNQSAVAPTLNYVTQPVVRQKDSTPFTVSGSWINSYALAGAYIKDANGGKHLGFVTWDTSSSDGLTFDIAMQQPDGSFLVYEGSFPSWCAPTEGTAFPHNYFSFNRQGTKLIATIATYRPELEASSFLGRRYITGVVEWDVQAVVDINTGAVSVTTGVVFEEHDDGGYLRYAAADYRWNDDGTDTAVVLKIRTELSDWFSDTIGTYTYEHKMFAAYAEWHEYISGVEQAAFRSKQVFSGPALTRVTDDNPTVTYDDVPPGSFLYTEDGTYFFGLSNSAVDAAHLNRHGYLWKIGTISALDLRADAFVITHGARVDSSLSTSSTLSLYPREYEYQCFGDVGGDTVRDLAGVGAAPPAYSIVGTYTTFDSGHSESGRPALRMTAEGETVTSLYSMFNSILAPAAALRTTLLRCDFITIHPSKHWAAYTQLPDRWMYNTTTDISSGVVGSNKNRRLFDTIKIRQLDGSYRVTSHKASIESVWGSSDPVDGVIEVNLDGYLATAAAGIWAV